MQTIFLLLYGQIEKQPEIPIYSLVNELKES